MNREWNIKSVAISKNCGRTMNGKKYLQVMIEVKDMMLINYQFWNRLMSSARMSEKYGCFKDSFIDILRAGSRANIFMQRSSPVLSKFLKWFSGLTALNLGKVGLKSGSLLMVGHSDWVGVPWNWKILKI